mmetsp:Transcript_88069/g.179921  ORF Transcript_88069/g.179921 Transcript_88069/m.179921 type:complete len:392 (-) Transcript_88069:650-1825(-)
MWYFSADEKAMLAGTEVAPRRDTTMSSAAIMACSRLGKLMYCAKRTMADSEASPFTFQPTSFGTSPALGAVNSRYFWLRVSISGSSQAPAAATSSSAKRAVVFSLMQSRNSLKVGELRSQWGSGWVVSACTRSVSNTSASYTRLAKVIMFWVRVPVLSEQMQVVEPKVSTPSMFFTSTIWVAMDLAVRDRHTVTVASRPSGTLATMIPMANTRLVMISVPRKTPTMKKPTPRTMATADTIMMKCLISLEMGVSSALVFMVSRATMPMKVWSPIRDTIPTPEPLVTLVPKKHVLLKSWGEVSTAISLVFISMSSGSPVKGALDTPRLLLSKIRMSAGTTSPEDSLMMSPRTRSVAAMSTHLVAPFSVVRTVTSFSMSEANWSMRLPALASWA